MKKTVKLTAVLLTLVMVMGVAVSCDVPFLDENGNFSGLNDIISIFTGDENKLVASSQNFEVYSGAAKCFFMNKFNGVTNSFLTYKVINLDADKPLEEQYISSGSTEAMLLGFEGTWLSYFVNETVNEIDTSLALCEYALAHGLNCSVSDEEIANTMGTLNSSCGSVAHINASIDKDDVAEYLGIKKLADAATEHIRKSLADRVTESEILSYAKDNKEEYECIDVIKYEFHVYSNDFESEEELVAHLDKSISHMEEVCAATTPEDFVKVMDEKSDDVADYVKKEYRRSNFNKEVADVLFNGDVGTTKYSRTESTAGSGTKYTFTAYMRYSEIYMARSRSYYYALFTDMSRAQQFIDEMKALEKYDFSEYKEIAERLGATVVEFRENQIKSTTSFNGNLVFENNYTVTIPNGSQLAPEIETDNAIKYKATDYSATYKDYTYAEGETGGLIFDYNDSTNLDNVVIKPEYSVVVPDNGAITVKPGDINGIYISTVGNGSVDAWVFDSARAEGDLTDTPVSSTGGFAALRYVGEGEFCYIVEAKNNLVADRLQDEINNARAKVSITYEESLEKLLATPKSSGFLGF